MRNDQSLAHVSAAAFLVVSGFLAVALSLGVTIAYAEEVADSRTKAEILEDEAQAEREARTSFTVNPIVANEKAKPRDIIKKELVITNNMGHKIDLYISVQNVDPTQGGQEFVSPGVADLSQSLANWIEITRGVIELAPNESRKIPYLIHVNVTAKPGTYFARILFGEGVRRSTASSGAGEDGTSLLLNLEVQDDAKERLQLGTFTSDDSVIMRDNVSFSYLLENIGNRTIEPRGAIRIFNRRGEEVGSVPLNPEGVEITPDNTEQLAAAWSASGRFGKYKAFLDLEYGESQLASVQDTVYFWVFPWKEIFATVIGVLVLAVIGTYVIHMRTVARPTPQRISYAPEPHQAYSTPASVEMPSSRANPTPQPTSYAAGGATTVLPSRRVATPAARAEVRTKGVAQPVQPASRPQVHGNVVQLSSRRS
jgi:predicted lipid-binding transport protein (Tim44 family)